MVERLVRKSPIGAVEGRLHTHDWHATILHLLGLDRNSHIDMQAVIFG